MTAPDPQVAAEILGTDEPLLTTDEVGAMLRKDPKTIVRYINTGELDGIRVGRTWRVKPSSVRAALKRWGEEA